MDRHSRYDAKNAPKPDFSQEIMERLFFWARDRAASAIAGIPSPSREALGDWGRQPVLGAFVSFKKRGRLRSCMGYMRDGICLADALDASAETAALRDPRFPPVRAEELYDLDLEVWALGSMREILEKGEARLGSFKIGSDGLQIISSGRRGLLLPSVPVELGWSPEQFLEGLCAKAGLARSEWKSQDARLFAFEGVSFKKPFVWQVSRNPALAKLIQSVRVSETGSNATHPSFSLNPNAFELYAPRTQSLGKSETSPSSLTRPPAVAGMFYPASAPEQNANLDAIEKILGTPAEKLRVSGAMTPHAGWKYSARLATETLSRVESVETIVVLAPKHRREGGDLAVMPFGAWDYGGGTTRNDLEFAEEFIRAIPDFKMDPVAHRSEHSIEVLLPILARFFPKSKVVGVLIGRASQTELDACAERFAAFLNERDRAGKPRVLLLVSSDMNHYENDATTRKLDKLATDALETTNPGELLRTVVGRRISMCGILPAYLTLSTLKRRGEFSEALRVGYATSGDAGGDLERVVGYAGYLFR